VEVKPLLSMQSTDFKITPLSGEGGGQQALHSAAKRPKPEATCVGLPVVAGI
jgi:hypothetical protein